MRYLITSILLFSVVVLLAQESLSFSVNLPIEKKNRKTIKDQTASWLVNNKGTIVKETKDTIWAISSINFDNTIVYNESKTYNRVYRDQTNGQITYKIKIYFVNNRAKAELFSFKHQPSNSFDNVNFGILTTANVAPKQTQSLTNTDYSLKVWNLLKKTVGDFVSSIDSGNTDMADSSVE